MLGEAGLLQRASANGSVISLGFHVPDFGEDLRPIRLTSTQIQRIFGSAVSDAALNQTPQNRSSSIHPAHLVPEVGYADERNPHAILRLLD